MITFCCSMFSKIPELIKFLRVSFIVKNFLSWKLKDNNWILTLAFLFDICDHLKFKWFKSIATRRKYLFPDAISKILVIKSKLALYQKELENYDFSNFKYILKCDIGRWFQNWILPFDYRFYNWWFFSKIWKSMELFHLA